MEGRGADAEAVSARSHYWPLLLLGAVGFLFWFAAVGAPSSAAAADDPLTIELEAEDFGICDATTELDVLVTNASGAAIDDVFVRLRTEPAQRLEAAEPTPAWDPATGKWLVGTLGSGSSEVLTLVVPTDALPLTITPSVIDIENAEAATTIGPARAPHLSLRPTSVEIHEGQTTTLTGSVTGALGCTLAGTVEWTGPTGGLTIEPSTWQSTSDGDVGTFTVRGNLAGDYTVTIDGSGTTAATAAVTVGIPPVPPPTIRLRFDPDHDRVCAARAATVLRATATDHLGRPVSLADAGIPGTTVALNSTPALQTPRSVILDDNGTARVAVRADGAGAASGSVIAEPPGENWQGAHYEVALRSRPDGDTLGLRFDPVASEHTAGSRVEVTLWATNPPCAPTTVALDGGALDLSVSEWRLPSDGAEVATLALTVDSCLEGNHTIRASVDGETATTELRCVAGGLARLEITADAVECAGRLGRPVAVTATNTGDATQTVAARLDIVGATVTAPTGSFDVRRLEPGASVTWDLTVDFDTGSDRVTFAVSDSEAFVDRIDVGPRLAQFFNEVEVGGTVTLMASAFTPPCLPTPAGLSVEAVEHLGTTGPADGILTDPPTLTLSGETGTPITVTAQAPGLYLVRLVADEEAAVAVVRVRPLPVRTLALLIDGGEQDKALYRNSLGLLGCAGALDTPTAEDGYLLVICQLEGSDDSPLTIELTTKDDVAITLTIDNETKAGGACTEQADEAICSSFEIDDGRADALPFTLDVPGAGGEVLVTGVVTKGSTVVSDVELLQVIGSQPSPTPGPEVLSETEVNDPPGPTPTEAPDPDAAGATSGDGSQETGDSENAAGSSTTATSSKGAASGGNSWWFLVPVALGAGALLTWLWPFRRRAADGQS